MGISFSKFAFAALLAYSVQGRSARDDDADYNRLFGKASAKKQGMKARGGIAANLFDDDTPYYYGKCCLKNNDGNKSGKVIFHQEAGSDFSSVSARVRGAGADHVHRALRRRSYQLGCSTENRQLRRIQTQ